MKNINLIFISTFLLTTLILSCSKKDDEQTPAPDPQAQNLTIFFVNDVHGQIDNFSKIKYIVEQEEQHTQVIVAGSLCF